MSLNIGITGATGRIGRELLKHPTTFSLVCDVTRPQEVEMAIRKGKPDLVVHLASVSDVDVCEKKENEKWVTDVNVRGTANVAEACLSDGIGMVLLSTAHVFSGNWWVSYRENDMPHPTNYYGYSKMGAEALCNIYPHMKVVRTSYLFDRTRLLEHLEPLQNGEHRDYPTFIIRSFMYLHHFVESLYAYLTYFEQMPDMLHIAGSQAVSWYEFISKTAREFGIPEQRVRPRKNDLKNGFAPRPYRGSLNVELSKRLGLPQYSYLDGVREILHG